MKTFPAYKESDLLQLPFFSVLDLYNRALELETGDVIEPIAPHSDIDNSDQLVYNPDNNQYE